MDTQAGNTGNDIKKKREEEKKITKNANLQNHSNPRNIWSSLQTNCNKERERGNKKLNDHSKNGRERERERERERNSS